MEPVQLAAVLAAVVVVASMISVELGVSVALLELGLGVVVGNLFDLNPNEPWLVFVAALRCRSGRCRSSGRSSSPESLLSECSGGR